MSIAADSIDELRQWDPLVDRLTREGSLAARLPYDDPHIPGRRHEALLQYHDGVPVHGADVMRQMDRGSTVSIFGTLYAGIDVDTTPRLTVDQARAALEAASGTTLASGQQSHTDDPADARTGASHSRTARRCSTRSRTSSTPMMVAC